MALALRRVAAGLAGAFALTRLMRSLLFGVSPADPLTFVVISLLLAFITLLASYVQAHRAANIEPIVSLRYE
jgi:putative ABC transport system permease protein